MVASFVGPMRAEVGRAIYVWGRVGEIVPNEDWIRRYETSVSNADRAIDTYRDRVEEKPNTEDDPIRAFDCSGLIVWRLRALGIDQTRYTANMMSVRCPTIPKSELRVGDLVFNLDDDGKAFHVGVVSKIESGVTYIVEARGRAYGVVERPITMGAWDDWSHNPFINTEVRDTVYVQYGDGRTTDTSSDPAVKSMQEGLVKLGHEMVNAGKTYPPDGRYGTATVNGVAAFKLANKLPGDGQTFDSACLTVMLTQLAALETGVPQAEVDAIKANLADEVRKSQYLVGQIEVQKQIVVGLNVDLSKAKAAQAAAEQYAEGRQALLDRANARLLTIRNGHEAAAMGPV